MAPSRLPLFFAILLINISCHSRTLSPSVGCFVRVYIPPLLINISFCRTLSSSAGCFVRVCHHLPRSITPTQEPTETQRKVGTTLLLAFFTAIGVLLTDLGFVVSFGGAVLGSALVFIFPTMMWISKCKKDVKMGMQLKVRQSSITSKYSSTYRRTK